MVGLTSEEIAAALQPLGTPRYRGAQVAHWIYRRFVASFDAMTDLPAGLRSDLESRYALRTATMMASDRAPDGAVKHVLRLGDGQTIECVYLPYAERVSVCLSTQAGCPVGCAFCATGRSGYARNLTAGEIAEQFLTMQADRPNRRISHAVYMGMGEPLLNLDNVLRSIRLLTKEVQVSARNLTLSTVGVAPGIRSLADSGVRIGLALSLHAPDDGLRSELIPTARKWPLAEVLGAVDYYREVTGRDVAFEYLLISGVNDSADHARRLAALLGRRRGAVNLIPYNPIEGAEGMAPPAAETIERFREALTSRGRVATVRMRRGRAARAACGQLRARVGSDDYR